MNVDLVGLAVLVVLYVGIFIVGVLAARKYGGSTNTTQLESSVVANRNIGGLVGVFTMTATTVGGGYINGTAESIGSSGLIWTQAPFGIFIGLSLGGLIFAKPMREKCYMTMLDPLYEQYGSTLVVLVYCASLCGDLFWTASILLALGTSLSVILNVGLTVAIICSASVTVFYTMIGLMVSVAYTDVVQLCLITFGLNNHISYEFAESVPLIWFMYALPILALELAFYVIVPSQASRVPGWGTIAIIFLLVFGTTKIFHTLNLRVCDCQKVFSVPFILTNEKVGSIDPVSTDWMGELDSQYIGQWVDLAIVMTFGTIPWQAYFQRVLSVRSSRQAQLLSVVGGALSLILVIPSVLIGAAAKNAAWNTTGYGCSPLNSTDASMTLPLVLHEFSPRPVAVIALGSISAAVMSSMDSAVLASSSMFTCNIYKQILRQKASQRELLWIQRFAVFLVGAMATVISIFVPVIYGLFILAADVVFVIVLPQLTCSLFFKSTNAYGAIVGYTVGLLFRVGAGEPYLNVPPLIKYPLYTESTGQVFPFRTFSMSLSFFSIIAVSLLMKYLFSKHILSKSFDVLNVFCDCSQQRRLSTQEHSYCAPADQLKCLYRKTSTTPHEHGDGEISENCL